MVPISSTTIQPTDTLVSFDVESLFTNVPVDQACDIVKQRLEADPPLQDRTRLNPDQIHDLLLTCLNLTCFRWTEEYYKQEQGAVMGSPLSPIIANIFMEHFETQATTLHLAPLRWGYLRHMATQHIGTRQVPPTHQPAAPEHQFLPWRLNERAPPLPWCFSHQERSRPSCPPSQQGIIIIIIISLSFYSA